MNHRRRLSWQADVSEWRVDDAPKSLRAALAKHLARAGVRPSVQRDALVNEFLAARGHASAEELCDHLAEIGFQFEAPMVRQLMQLMSEWGLASVPHLYGDESDALGRMVCAACGAIEAIPALELASAHHAVAQEHGFVLDRHVLELRGRCAACSSAKHPKGDC